MADETEVLVEDAGVLASLERENVDLQITTAKRFPRSIESFQRNALTLATLDEDTARSMYYRLPRDGKFIEGGSVRLAEICATCWGNAQIGARIVDIGERMLTAQAAAWDMENNLRISVEIRRGIINKFGKRYNDDMIRTTANAAMSIAFRNAVFRIVSPALVKSILEKAKETSLGRNLSMAQKRENALKALGEYGANEKDILKVLNRKGMADVGVEELITLQGMYTAMKEGETTWAEILDSQPKTEEEIAASLRTSMDEQAGTKVAADTKQARTRTAPKPARPTPPPPPPPQPEPDPEPEAASAESDEPEIAPDPEPQPQQQAQPAIDLNARLQDAAQDDLMDLGIAAGLNPSALRKYVFEHFQKSVQDLTVGEGTKLGAMLRKLMEG